MLKSKILWIVVGLIFIIGMYVMSTYNRLVTMNNQADGQWAQVESQYQRRFDLIPNLVATVQGAMKQETTIFTALANARASYAGARTINEKVVATQGLDSALSRLIAISENYPQLKSIDTANSLMVQLEGTENRIAVERMRYNDTVKDYNLKTKTFPSSFIARMFGLSDRAYFKNDVGSATAPKVNL